MDLTNIASVTKVKVGYSEVCSVKGFNNFKVSIELVGYVGRDGYELAIRALELEARKAVKTMVDDELERRQLPLRYEHEANLFSVVIYPEGGVIMVVPSAITLIWDVTPVVQCQRLQASRDIAIDHMQKNHEISTMFECTSARQIKGLYDRLYSQKDGDHNHTGFLVWELFDEFNHDIKKSLGIIDDEPPF